MSGSTIGGVVGAVIGFYFGNPQLGWMIGSAIGGYVDPEVIQGPRIKDAQTQTSNDGVPRPIVYGTAAIAGNVIARGELTHRTVTTSQGKGGPEVEEDHVYLTYAIRICEGPIAGIRRVWRDDKLVFDVSDMADRPELDGDDWQAFWDRWAAAMSNSFASKATFYLGDETQLPDPSLEAIYGVGETPAYRGTAYMVVTDDDLTERRGSIPQYRFEVVGEGADVTTVTQERVVAPLSRFRNAHWPLEDGEADYTYTGYRLTGSGDITDTFSAATIGAVQDHFAQWYDGINAPPTHYLGYSASGANDLGSHGYDQLVAQADVTDNESLILVYNQAEPEYYVAAAADSFCPVIPYPGANNASPMYADETGIVCYKEADANPSANPGTTFFNNCISDPDNGGYAPQIAGWYPLYIRVERRGITPAYGEPGDPCELKKRVLMPDTGSAMIDCDGQLSALAEYEEVSGTFLQLAETVLDTTSPPAQIVQYPLGPVLELTDPNAFVQAYWEAEYAAAVTAGTMPAGLTYGVDYPVETTTALTATTSERVITTGMVALSDIVLDIADRVGVSASKMDVTDLAGMEVRGYVLGRQMEAGAALRGLQQPFLFDMPEWDGKVRCIRRGGEIAAIIDDDDLIERMDEDEDTRAQSLEFPRKLHVAYPDPTKAYAVTKQTSERRSSQVKAESESGVELALPLFPDEAATICHRLHKIAWADAEGVSKFALPEEFSYLTPSDCVERNGKRLRIDTIETRDGQQVYEARFDRVSAYSGEVSGVNAPAPSRPVTNLRGPTRLEFLNIPPLRDSDDRIGYYVAVCGILDTWQGCLLQEEVSGTFATRAVIGEASVMGFTTTDLPDAQPWTYYEDATLTVQVHGGEPTSATFDQVLREANGFAIGNSDVWEICQFTTVTDNGGGSYTLSGLTRGRLDTTPEAWPADSRFVLLNAPVFIETTAAQIGQTITLRPASNGTVPANNYTEEHAFTVCNAQKEWAPILLETTRDASNNIEMRWVGRGRLGTNINAFHGQYFAGYRVTIQKGSAIENYYAPDSTFTYTADMQTADFGSATGTLTVSIYAMNRITGASEPLRGTV